MKYHTLTDNIKFPTYRNDTLLSTIMKPVTLLGIIEEFSFFYQSLVHLEEIYSGLIEIDPHDLSKRFLELKRGARYYSAGLQGLKRAIIIIAKKIKIQFNLTENQTENNLFNAKVMPFISPQSSTITDDNDDNAILKELLEFQSKKENDILSSQKRIELNLISCTIKYGQHVLESVFNEITNYKLIKIFNSSRNELILMNLILNLDNVIVTTIALYNSFFIDECDIFNLDEDSETWKRIKKNMVRVIVNDQARFIQEMQTFSYQTEIMFGALSKGFTSKNQIKNIFSSIYCGVLFSYDYVQGSLELKRFLVNINDQLLINISKISTIPYVKAISKAIYPTIAYRKKIYIKRNEKEITIDYINEILKHFKTNEDKPLAYQPNEINPDDIPYKDKTEKNEKHLYVSTRLIHSSKLHLKKHKHKPFIFNTIFNRKKSKVNETKDSLMIYIHGGGYVSGSTFGSERFIRPWANALNIPILGINYSLSPKYQYPKAVDDVWQAYNWIIKYAKEELNINPQHIIVCGDSAGGSICLSLVYLLIIHSIPLPELVLLFYPCCEQDPCGMSPSQLLVMQDNILNYKAMEFYNRAYVGRESNLDDFITNQAKAPQCILKLLPKIRFFIGTLDPLRDGAIRVINKISEAGIDCKAYDFEDYGHAFLTFVGKLGNEVMTSILYKEIREHFESMNVNSS